jgi:TRAP-type C4-dicarboxylate transport system substrate-binding protein
LGKIVAKDMEEKANTKMLGLADYGGFSVISKKPVAKLEDFKGQRIRSAGEYFSYCLEALGAVPVMMSSGETYQAIQRGTVDGGCSGPTTFVSRKWYEVAKHVPSVDLQPVFAFVTVANLDFWNKLPQDLQQIFAGAAVEVENWTAKVAAEEDQRCIEELKAKGVVFDQVSKEEFARWRQAMAPYLAGKVKERVGDKGKQMLDLIAAAQSK